MSFSAKALHIAVAANFQATYQQLASAFTAIHPHIRLSYSTASSGVLYAQIVRGAPFDVFLSADAHRPIALNKAGLVVPGSLQTYAVGQLVLWAPRQQRLVSQQLADWPDKIALAQPSIAPYGLAAKQSLQALGYWSHLQDQLITMNNQLQVAQLLHSGVVDLGFVAASQVAEGKGAIWRVPQHLHQPLLQLLVILKGAEKRDILAEAKQFKQFLLSTRGQQIIRQAGYLQAEHAR